MKLENLGGFLPMIMVFVFLYFMIIAPQRKKEKKVREMRNSLEVGNEVITIGGIIGKVINITDDEITIETSIEKTKVKVIRQAINELVENKED